MVGDLLAGRMTSGLSFGTQRPALSYQYSMVIVVMCTAFVPCYIQPRWSKIVVEIVGPYVWCTDNAELLFRTAHQDGIRRVVWSPDGQQLLFASNNANGIFWNSSNGYWIDHPCTGHSDTIYSLAISSDSTFIVTASADNNVRMWNTMEHCS